MQVTHSIDRNVKDMYTIKIQTQHNVKPYTQ